MQWATGLRELGWDVWLSEHLSREELKKLDPDFDEERPWESVPAKFWGETTKAFGFENRATLWIEDEALDGAEFRRFATEAEAFLNYSGQFKRLDFLGNGTRKIYLDVDPAFTQVWAVAYGCDMNFAGHDAFVTVGLNLSKDIARVPQTGHKWIPIPPPVTLSMWPRQPAPRETDPGWTTVAHWYGYGEVEWEGQAYGGKRESFLALARLPQLVNARFTVATDLQPEWGDYNELEACGWHFKPAREIANSIQEYQKFIAASRGEVGVAKTGYVRSRCGWISDRSVCYLAMGRPVVLHDTGWNETLGLTEGMLPFGDPESCARAVEEMEKNYAHHSDAARRLAETMFSSERVLSEMLERCGL